MLFSCTEIVSEFSIAPFIWYHDRVGAKVQPCLCPEDRGPSAENHSAGISPAVNGISWRHDGDAVHFFSNDVNLGRVKAWAYTFQSWLFEWGKWWETGGFGAKQILSHTHVMMFFFQNTSHHIPCPFWLSTQKQCRNQYLECMCSLSLREPYEEASQSGWPFS